MKMRPVVSETFHTKRQTDEETDITNLIVGFAILQTRLTRGGRSSAGQPRPSVIWGSSRENTYCTSMV